MNGGNQIGGRVDGISAVAMVINGPRSFCSSAFEIYGYYRRCFHNMGPQIIWIINRRIMLYKNVTSVLKVINCIP